MTPAWAVGPAVLAADPETAEAGPTGLFVIILLAIGIFFLSRSMIKHLRRVPQSFDPPPEPGPAPSSPHSQAQSQSQAPAPVTDQPTPDRDHPPAG